MSIRQMITGTALALVLSAGAVQAQTANPAVDVTAVAGAVDAVMPEVVDWRRDFHRHPELGFAETRTAAIIAAPAAPASSRLEVRTLAPSAAARMRRNAALRAAPPVSRMSAGIGPMAR